MLCLGNYSTRPAFDPGSPLARVCAWDAFIFASIAYRIAGPSYFKVRRRSGPSMYSWRSFMDSFMANPDTDSVGAKGYPDEVAKKCH